MSRFADNRLGTKPICQWSFANQNFYAHFRRWLREGGYGDSALMLYGVAARLALGYLDKAYWLIQPEADLDRVRDAIAAQYESATTRSTYGKGLSKLAEYLRFRCHRPTPEKQVSWAHFLDPLPTAMADDVRTYLAHRRRAWRPEDRFRATNTVLSDLTLSLRWMVTHGVLTRMDDLTPGRWFDYVDARLAAGIKAVTINGELAQLQHLLRFLDDAGRTVCSRMMQVGPLDAGSHLPRDVPSDQLRRLLEEIQLEIASDHAGNRRMGLLDRAWFLVMLHSGLRTGEVRRLLLEDLDLDGRQVRIDQSKGLKDRIVCLSSPAVEALRAYLAVRGPATGKHVFLYRHQPLSISYCSQRLRTYGRRCGVVIIPHQLRHSCATLLLNAGAPVLTVQTILGHKFIDTTLRYARLYDGTVAADYYRAMAEVESHFRVGEYAGRHPTAANCWLWWTLCALGHSTTAKEKRSTLCGPEFSPPSLRSMQAWSKATMAPGPRWFDTGAVSCYIEDTQGRAGESDRFRQLPPSVFLFSRFAHRQSMLSRLGCPLPSKLRFALGGTASSPCLGTRFRH